MVLGLRNEIISLSYHQVLLASALTNAIFCDISFIIIPVIYLTNEGIWLIKALAPSKGTGQPFASASPNAFRYARFFRLKITTIGQLFLNRMKLTCSIAIRSFTSSK